MSSFLGIRGRTGSATDRTSLLHPVFCAETSDDSNLQQHDCVRWCHHLPSVCKWFDFDIHPGMGTCGHEASQQFGVRLLVHVEVHGCKWTAARFDFGIRLGMGTCGHDTSRQFGERLLVHVKEYDANGWNDCVQHASLVSRQCLLCAREAALEVS